MYEWLSEALVGDDSHVITANRRLSRTLEEEYVRQRLAAGDAGWRRPVIVPAADWYTMLADRLKPRADRPARLSPGNSRVLWEQTLRADIDEPMLNIGSLAKQCLETWNRLHDWCVPLDECVVEARGQDQRIFARAALRYGDRLASEHWIDDALFRATLPRWLLDDAARPPRTVTLAGFDRVNPRLAELLDQFAAAGCVVHERPPGQPANVSLRRYPNVDAELRAAGAWARRRLTERPDSRIAVVVISLEQERERAGRLLREGMTPGWQYGPARQREAVNVSYGRRLTEYPAIGIAMLALRWLGQPLDGRELGLLLRSPLLGIGELSGRCRLEQKLRDWPDRRWSRSLLLEALQPEAERIGGCGWVEAFAALEARLEGLPARQRPRAWAELFSEILEMLGWPGKERLDSADYQLENRFRELLGEFARLELVQSDMTLGEAVSRLSVLAADTMFQPETVNGRVDVLGPLEAAGQSYDALWIAGMTSADWPPSGRPSPLLSRQLQRRYDMPDATPDDTVRQAARLLDRLLGDSGQSVTSYPAMIGDAEQMQSALLGERTPEDGDDDPGWHAVSLLGRCALVEREDPVPRLQPGETVAGGARTLDLQTRDPLAAFAAGRLDIRLLRPFRTGIGADVRGNLLHDALRALYASRPTRDEIAAWDADERVERTREAAGSAFAPVFRFAGDTLRQLLRLEEQRAVSLLGRVIELDSARDTFSIDAVEQRLDARIGPLTLSLRADRVDRLPGDALVILDYKTSRTQKFATAGEPNDVQLPVYALAVEAPVSGLGLFRVDSARVEVDGAGPGLGYGNDWEKTLRAWQQGVLGAAVQFANGDVRLNVRQTILAARPLSLLSRFAERVRDV